MPMTDMFFTALSAVLISNRVLQMPLAIGSVLATVVVLNSIVGHLLDHSSSPFAAYRWR